MTNKDWKALKRKKRRTCGHGVQRIWKLYSKGRRAGKLTWCEPLETIWTIVDKTTYKDPAPKTLDELREWLRFAWKNVSLDTLWELVHSMLFLTNEPAKKAEIQQGLGIRPGTPWVAISGVYKAAYITCTSSRLLNQPLFGFFFYFCFLAFVFCPF